LSSSPGKRGGLPVEGELTTKAPCSHKAHMLPYLQRSASSVLVNYVCTQADASTTAVEGPS
jgi:hypothetical protein